MSLQNRETLKSFFRKGNLPTEGDFADFIDSAVNRVDDGLSKTMDEGLMLSPIGKSEKLLSFYRSIEEKNPAWSIGIDVGESTLRFNNFSGEHILSLTAQGRLGIKTDTPRYTLEVNGILASRGRIGTFETGKVLADGNWHTILSDLEGCQMFEVVAGIGKKKTGKYAVVYALALSTFGNSKNKIDVKQAYYGVKCNKIDLRWSGSTYKYNLEMRSHCDYGGGQHYIRYYISQLWKDPFMHESTEE